MNESLYQLIWYFFIYAFLGWCGEILFASVKEHKVLNRGLLNGPLCPIYGFSMVLILIFLETLKEHFIFLVLGSAVIATVMEYYTGALMEKVLKRKWWDYSGYRYNLGGYVCLPFSLLWGLAAAVSFQFFHPLVRGLTGLLPLSIGKLVLLALIVVFVIDFLTVAGVLAEAKRLNKPVTELMEGMQQISNRLGRIICGYVQKRMTKAHPALTRTAQAELAAKESARNTVFAWGCSFHKLVWLFFIGAFLGDITETIFCYFTSGVIMSRSSVVYGPFSIVWGIGIIVLTMMLHRYRDRHDRYIFVFGTVVGGAYEYICSVFTELAFGTVFWDYSEIPFNLGGRINLLYCFFWGVAAVIWIKMIYPYLSGLIERVPMKAGKILSWVMLIFMTVNIIISAFALARYSSRQAGQPADHEISIFLDKEFPDSRMERIYPNIILTD